MLNGSPNSISGWSVLLITIVGLVGMTACANADDYRRLLAEGNKLYQEGRHDEALVKYQEAQIERPEAPEVQYNIAGAQYQQGAFEDAATTYHQVMTTESAQLEADAHYNMGNALFRQQDYPAAIEAYKRSLTLTPEDLDAKFNLELARKLLKENLKPQEQEKEQQQQEQQEQEQEQEEEQEENDDQQEQQQQQQQNEEEQQEEGQQQEQDADSTQNDQQQQQQYQPQEGMTKEDAERILDALKDEEKRLQKEKRKAAVRQPSRRAKDW